MKRTVRYTVLVLIAIINSLVITTSLYAVLPKVIWKAWKVVRMHILLSLLARNYCWHALSN